MEHTARALVAVGALAFVGCSGRSEVTPSGSGGAGTDQETTWPDEFVVAAKQPRVDVGHDNHAVLAFASEQSLRAMLYRQRSEGSHWGEPVELVPSVVELDQSKGGYEEAGLRVQAVEASASGVSWVLYSRVEGTLFEAGSESAIYLQRHVGGAGKDADWSAPELVATVPFRVYADPSPPNAHLAVSESGRVVVAWSAWGGTISVRTRALTGEWSSVEEVPDSSSAGPITALSMTDTGYFAVAYSSLGETLVSYGALMGSWTTIGGSYGQAGPTPAGKLWVSARSGDSIAPYLYHPGRDGLLGPALSLPPERQGAEPRVTAVVGADEGAQFFFSSGDGLALDGPQNGGLALASYDLEAGWSESIDLVSRDGSTRGIAVDGNDRGHAAVVFSDTTATRLYRTHDGSLTDLAWVQGFAGPVALARDGRALVVAQGAGELDVRWVP